MFLLLFCSDSGSVTPTRVSSEPSTEPASVQRGGDSHNDRLILVLGGPADAARRARETLARVNFLQPQVNH